MTLTQLLIIYAAPIIPAFLTIAWVFFIYGRRDPSDVVNWTSIFGIAVWWPVVLIVFIAESARDAINRWIERAQQRRRGC